MSLPPTYVVLAFDLARERQAEARRRARGGSPPERPRPSLRRRLAPLTGVIASLMAHLADRIATDLDARPPTAGDRVPQR